MGAFYGNITIKGPSQQKVAEALQGRRAIVTPNIGDYTVVFDSVCDAQDIGGIQALASRLSGEFRCFVLAVVVHDDDVFVFFLYLDGKLSDQYNSCPSYFDFGSTGEPANPTGGDAKRLCSAFGSNNQNDVESILHTRRGKAGYVFETERHKDLVRVLALPDCAVGKALESFDRGDYPNGMSAQQMVRAANPPPLEDRQQRLDREFYNQLGSEDSSRPCKRDGCTKGAIPNSVMCKRHHFEMIQRRDCPFDY